VKAHREKSWQGARGGGDEGGEGAQSDAAARRQSAEGGREVGRSGRKGGGQSLMGPRSRVKQAAKAPEKVEGLQHATAGRTATRNARQCRPAQQERTRTYLRSSVRNPLAPLHSQWSFSSPCSMRTRRRRRSRKRDRGPRGRPPLASQYRLRERRLPQIVEPSQRDQSTASSGVVNVVGECLHGGGRCVKGKKLVCPKWGRWHCRRISASTGAFSS
jgi:hypothetical protein